MSERTFGIITIIVVALIISLVIASSNEYNNFMDACKQDHKEYECKVMWRQSQPDSVNVTTYTVGR